MSNKATWENLVKPVVVLVVICLIVSALLAVTNNATAPVIAENERQTTLAAYLQVLPSVSDAGTLEDVDVSALADSGVSAAVKTADGQFAIKSTAVGYDGGVITTILGFDANGAVQAIWSDSTTQTAGMGSKCDNPEFTSQFVGKDSSAQLTLNTDVDQVAGCTVSSKAFVAAVNSAINCYNEVKGAA